MGVVAKVLLNEKEGTMEATTSSGRIYQFDAEMINLPGVLDRVQNEEEFLLQAREEWTIANMEGTQTIYPVE